MSEKYEGEDERAEPNTAGISEEEEVGSNSSLYETISRTAFYGSILATELLAMAGCAEDYDTPEEAIKSNYPDAELEASKDTDPENNNGSEVAIAKVGDHGVNHHDIMVYAFKNSDGEVDLDYSAMKDHPIAKGREKKEDFKGFGRIYKRQKEGQTEYAVETIFQAGTDRVVTMDEEVNEEYMTASKGDVFRTLLTPTEDGNYEEQKVDAEKEAIDPEESDWELIETILDDE